MEHDLKIIYILLLLEVKHTWKKTEKIYDAVIRLQHPANSNKDENTLTEIQPVSYYFT